MEVAPYEQKYIDEFRRDYLRSECGKYNLDVQVAHLARLAEYYCYRYSRTDDWTDCLRAHTLYNSAAARSIDREELDESAFQVQKSYWKGCTNITYKEQKEITHNIENELLTIRDSARNELEGTEKTVKDFDLDSNRPSNAATSANFIDSVRGISVSCSERMINLTEKIIQESVELLNEQPPCAFTAVAIGSLARGEATPYSDLEYLFLVEEKNDATIDYFVQLAMTNYFLIGNLGETKLKYMAIPELKGWFDDKSKNGLKIDGLAKAAGNIPTGNGSPETKNRFICTPEELFAEYKEVLDNPTEDALRGDLSAMMTYMKPLFSHKSGENLLLELKESMSLVEPNKVRREANVHMFESDMAKFNFTPDVRLKEQAYTVDVKGQLYRFPSILLFDLSIVHGIVDSTAWDTADKLLHAAKISEHVHKSLLFQLACACYIRLSAYLFHDSQDDRISVADRFLAAPRPSGEISNSFRRWYVSAELILALCDSIIPLKQRISTIDEDVICVLMSMSSQQSSLESQLHRMKTLLFSGRFAKAYTLLLRLIPNILSLEKGSVEEQLASVIVVDPQILETLGDVLQQNSQFELALIIYLHINDQKSSDRVKVKIASCHGEMSQYEQALIVLQSCDQESPDVLFSVGSVYHSLSKFDEAEEHVIRALQLHFNSASGEIELDYYGALINEIKTTHVDLKNLTPKERLQMIHTATPALAPCINALGTIYWKKEKHELAEAYRNHFHKLTLSLYGGDSLVPAAAAALNSVGLSLMEKKMYTQAHEYYTKSLNMYQSIYDAEGTHVDIAMLLNNIGVNFVNLGDFVQAEKFYQDALAVYRNIYGDKSNHPCIIRPIENLAALFNDQKKYHEGELYYREAYNIHTEIYGENADRPEIAKTLKHLGTSHYNRELHLQADNYYRQSLAIYEKVSDVKRYHMDIADLFFCFSRNCNSNKEYSKTIEWGAQFLTMFTELYGIDSKNYILADIRVRIGIAHELLNNFSTAADYFGQAIQIYQHSEIDGATPEHIGLMLGIALKSKADNHRELGEHTDAIICRSEALVVYQRMHKEDHNHGDIADTLCDMGTDSRNLHQYTMAQAYLLDALVLWQDIQEVEHIKLKKKANLLKTLGDNFNDLGQYGTAEEYYKETVETYTQLYGANSNNIYKAEVLRSMAVNYYNMESFDLAEQHYLLCLNMYQIIYGEESDNPHISEVLVGLSGVYISKGDNEKAQELAMVALTSLQKTDPDNQFVSVLRGYLQSQGLHPDNTFVDL